HRKIRRRLAENLVRLAQFAILPFKGLHLLGHLGRDAGALAAVDFGLLDPVVQRLRGAADLRRNRHDRLPARRVVTLVVENQPHRALAHFRGKLVRRLAHDAPSYSGVGASGKPGAVHVDIFYSHLFDPDTPLEETCDALDHAVRSGKALYAGISSYNSQRTREAADILKQMGTPFLIHQPSYSMFNRWVE